MIMMAMRIVGVFGVQRWRGVPQSSGSRAGTALDGKVHTNWANDPVVSRFEAQISVQSTELDLKTIESRLGHSSGPSGVSMGDWSRVRADHAYPWSIWRRDLDWSRDSHAGTEGLDRAVRDLPADLADSIRELVAEGCGAKLTILQELGDDSNGWDCGFYLGVDALGWLARARASIIIDQYVLTGEAGVDLDGQI